MVATTQNPFVNKRPVYNTKESFEKESANLLSPTDNLYIRQHFIKISIKNLCSFLYFYVNMFYLFLFIEIDMLEG